MMRNRHQSLPLFLLSALLLASQPNATAAAAKSPFPVIGYFPSWTGASVGQIQFRNLTQVNYSFIGPTMAGGITDPVAPLLSELVAKAHKQNVKVGVAIGGWNNGNTAEFEKIGSKPMLRARFVGHVMDLVDLYRLDVIDIDWEFPNAGSADGYAALMSELGEALHKQGKLLSTAVIAKDDFNGAYIHKEVFGAIDFLNIMAYDWNWADHAKPHSSFELADSSLAYWLQRGCPKEKALLGLPFYGRYPETPYRDLVGREPGICDKDLVGTVHYNGRPTIRRKTEMAYRKGGGVMIWELTQDTSDSTSLLSAIHDQILALQSATATTAGPVTAGPEGPVTGK